MPPEERQPVLPPMEAHKIDPNTGEDEMAFASASLVPAVAAADRDPKNPASWGKVGRNEIVRAAAARSTSTAMASTARQRVIAR